MHAIERLRTLIGLFGNSGGVLRNLSLLGTMIAEHPDLCVICSNETEAREIRARAGSEQGPSTAARIRHLGELDGLEDRTPPMELVFTPFAVQA
ncbi:hypothetical protein HN937_18055, partial [Candidatus Poribacteria bacterium]|nr:hypothetical protein [Candidatus Poribacteria bacterium]